jgi:hypothetical protein
MDARGNSGWFARGGTEKVGTWLASDFDGWEGQKGARGDDRRAYNMAMRCPLAQTVVFAVASLFACTPSLPAQATADLQCPPPTIPRDESPKGPEISFAEVTFSGSLQLPISDQDQIAASVKEESRGPSLDGLVDDALERVRAGWQNHGYFKVQVSGKMRRLAKSPDSQQMALSVHMDEGLQYRLSKITFRNTTLNDVEALRVLFPIKDGDVFSREKIAIGLENLRRAYGELGYVNFTAIPDAQVDDESKLVSLDIDINEGRQFHFTNVDVVGLDESSQQEILKDFPIGQVYDERLLDQFLEKYPSIFKFSTNDPWHTQKLFDERAGTVAVVLDARPCPAN